MKIRRETVADDRFPKDPFSIFYSSSSSDENCSKEKEELMERQVREEGVKKIEKEDVYRHYNRKVCF